ncbi:MAG: AAA family ATPase, partial [Oscillospiraceae bacterium]|nr:AAA family ATPase [Oscillospiraceae bacterium]
TLGDYPYHIFEKEPEEVEPFLLTGDFTGINVTVPYKKTVIPFLDELSPVSQKLCAVNTVVRRDGKLIGHNTDYLGFQSMVLTSGLSVCGKKALVLGSGGASNTAVAVLQELGAEVVVISRSGENNYNNLSKHQDAAILVNTTPVGMYPNTGVSPVNLDQLPKLEGVLDVIYNPARTQLLLDAENRGLVTMNGLLMLVAQAKESAEWFTGTSLPDDLISKIHKSLSQQMQNIVLIGMPGCGKSTVCKLLAEKCNKQFVDADEKIVELAGKSIPEIFAEDGQEVFRNLETQALEALGKQSGLVIATGGGCVTKERNYPLLHQNGIILWLQRNIAVLPTDGRPLSQSNDLHKMYAVRKPLYEAFADGTVINDGTLEDTLSQILGKLEEAL